MRAALLLALLCAACSGSSTAADAGADLTGHPDTGLDHSALEAGADDGGPRPDTTNEAAPDDAAPDDRQLEPDADAGPACTVAAECTQWAGGLCLYGHCCYPDGAGGLTCM